MGTPRQSKGRWPRNLAAFRARVSRPDIGELGWLGPLYWLSLSYQVGQDGVAPTLTPSGRVAGMSTKATSTVTGLHHVTAIAGDPQRNLDFYTGALGMRLVKRTVNQDAPDTYHLF